MSVSTSRITLTIGFETNSVNQLERLIGKLRSVESVTDIERSTNG